MEKWPIKRKHYIIRNTRTHKIYNIQLNACGKGVQITIGWFSTVLGMSSMSRPNWEHPADCSTPWAQLPQWLGFRNSTVWLVAPRIGWWCQRNEGPIPTDHIRNADQRTEICRGSIRVAPWTSTQQACTSRVLGCEENTDLLKRPWHHRNDASTKEPCYKAISNASFKTDRSQWVG